MGSSKETAMALVILAACWLSLAVRLASLLLVFCEVVLWIFLGL